MQNNNFDIGISQTKAKAPERTSDFTFHQCGCQSCPDNLRMVLGSAPIMACPAMLQKWPPKDPEIASLNHVDSLYWSHHALKKYKKPPLQMVLESFIY